MTESSPDTTLTWWRVALGVLVAWALYLAFFGPKAPVEGGLGAPLLEAPRPPKQADYGWTLRDRDDRPVTLAKYQGRAVFLNIWATWCPPCVRELPSIARLAADRRLKDVAFVCVSTDESPETLAAFLRDKSWPMTVLRATAVPDVFATNGIPATFLIAPDGRIASADVGSASWDDPSVVAFLERLAREPGRGGTAAVPVGP